MIRNKILIISLIIIVGSLAYSKTDLSDLNNEMKFQFGIGLNVTSSNIFGLIEDVNMMKAINNSNDIKLYGLSDEENKAINNAGKTIQNSILISNILGGFEYGIKTRILWNVLIADFDIRLLPFDGSYNGRLDFQLNPSIGIRAPFFISPYITVGPNFVFSFYPTDYDKIEKWKSSATAINNFVFTPGLTTRVGVDFKLKLSEKASAPSLGVFYQWSIKDFNEFTGFYNQLLETRSTSDAIGALIGYQSRFGVNFIIYLK